MRCALFANANITTELTLSTVDSMIRTRPASSGTFGRDEHGVTVMMVSGEAGDRPA